MPDEYVKKVNEAVGFIKQKVGANFTPHASLTLGSGLGKLAELIKPVALIPYADIPHFPQTTVAGHEGMLVVGTLEDVPILGFKGRKHYYEVAHLPDAMDQVTFYVQVAASLGSKVCMTTNAAGGLNHTFKIGDLMVIRSHIGLFLPNPLLGPHHDFGNNLYFQPLNDMYSFDLLKLFKSISPQIREGIYVAWSGRTYETQAESLLLRKLGADATGMSTIPEIIVAHNRGMQTLGVSIITNVIAEDGTNATNHEEVTAVLNNQTTENKLFTTFRSFFQKLKVIG